MVKHFGDIKKSENQETKYRWLELDNGMAVIMMSNPNCVHTSCRLRLESGTSDDPFDMQGMAHATSYSFTNMPSDQQDCKSLVSFLQRNLLEVYAEVSNFQTIFQKTGLQKENVAEFLKIFADSLFTGNFNEKNITKQLTEMDFKKELNKLRLYCDMFYFERILSNPGSVESKLL